MTVHVARVGMLPLIQDVHAHGPELDEGNQDDLCRHCGADGVIDWYRRTNCPVCGGSGQLPEESQLAVSEAE